MVPVLFTLMFGVLEFSYYFYQQHLVSTGVRDAARYLARVQDPTPRPRRRPRKTWRPPALLPAAATAAPRALIRRRSA